MGLTAHPVIQAPYHFFLGRKKKAFLGGDNTKLSSREGRILSRIAMVDAPLYRTRSMRPGLFHSTACIVVFLREEDRISRLRVVYLDPQLDKAGPFCLDVDACDRSGTW